MKLKATLAVSVLALCLTGASRVPYSPPTPAASNAAAFDPFAPGVAAGPAVVVNAVPAPNVRVPYSPPVRSPYSPPVHP